MAIYQLHYKHKLTRLMAKIADSSQFYPETKIICQAHFKNPQMNGNYYILKPADGSCQEGVSIVKTNEDIQKELDSHPEFQTWLLQRFIKSYLVKLSDDVYGRKMVLRTYVHLTDKNNIYLYKDVIATAFCHEYKTDTDIYQNINLIKQYHEKHKLPVDNSKYYFNLETLLGNDVYVKVWNQFKNILEKIFKVSIKDNTKNRLFGIDWIIDADLNAWLLEFNHNPDVGAYNCVILTDTLKQDRTTLDNFVKLVI